MVLHKEGKSNDNFFQDLKFGRHEIFQANKFVQLPQKSSHSYQIEAQQIYQIDYIQQDGQKGKTEISPQIYQSGTRFEKPHCHNTLTWSYCF